MFVLHVVYPISKVVYCRFEIFILFFCSFAVCLCAAAAGTGLSWTSPVLDQLKNENSTVHATESECTWIASFLPIGALFGAIPAGIMADKIGRRGAAIAITIPFIVSWLLTVFAKNVLMLYIARFLIGKLISNSINREYRTLWTKLTYFCLTICSINTGISTGGSCVVAPVFISEFAETSIRGLLGTCFQLFLTVGILIVYAVGGFTNWIVLSWVCFIIPCACLVGLFFVPDSPIWLLKQV